MSGGEELKPCPFCGGGKARTIHIRDGRKVACICGACGKPEFHGPQDRPGSEARAIAAWNTRTPDPLLVQALEALRPLAERKTVAEIMDEGDKSNPFWQLSPEDRVQEIGRRTKQKDAETIAARTILAQAKERGL